MRRHPARVTTAFAMGATVAVSLPVFLLGALFVQIGSEVSAPVWALGALVALFWIAAAAASSFAGDLDRRLGSRRLTLVSLGLAAVSTTGLALTVSSWPTMIVWTVVGGLSSGVQHPATNALITANVDIARRGLAFGLKQAAVPVATLIAGLAVPAVALSVGWRWAFAGAAVFCLLVQLVYVGAGRADRSVHRAARRTDRMPSPLAREFRVLSVVAFAGGATVTATTAYLIVTSVQRGMDVASAGVLLAVTSAIGALARAGLGTVIDRYRDASLLVAVGLVLASGLAALAIALGPEALFVAGAVWGSGVAGAWSGLMHYYISRTAGPHAAAATGMIQTGSFLGCAAGPVAFGLVAGVADGAQPWLMLAGVGLVGGLWGLGPIWRGTRPPSRPGGEAAA